jgi:hypothetical protein
MSSTTNSDRLSVLFDELAELAGQRNAIDGPIVKIARADRARQLVGARSVAALMASRLGLSSTTCVHHHRP